MFAARGRGPLFSIRRQLPARRGSVSLYVVVAERKTRDTRSDESFFFVFPLLSSSLCFHLRRPWDVYRAPRSRLAMRRSVIVIKNVRARRGVVLFREQQKTVQSPFGAFVLMSKYFCFICVIVGGRFKFVFFLIFYYDQAKWFQYYRKDQT